MTVKNLNKLSNIVTMLLVLVFVSSCGSGDEETSYKYQKLVKTAKVSEIKTQKQKQFSAVVEESEEVNLAFRVAGPIKKIYIKEGDYVKKGQLIAEMDTRDYMIQKNAIETQVEQLQKEYKRIAELYKRESVPENDYEKMKAGKEMAEEKLKNAIDQLNDTKLRAPMSGYITKVNFDENEMVNHGTPIATMIDVSLLKVEINVPASLYINKENITNFDCTQENIPGKVFPLTLYADNIKANSNGLYKLYLYYKPQKDSQLAPGMNVSVNVNYITSAQSKLSIPITALFEEDNKSYVWLVKDNSVKKQEISTNSMVKDGFIQITKGLTDGDEVVVAGINLLKENQKVIPIPKKSKTNVGGIL